MILPFHINYVCCCELSIILAPKLHRPWFRTRRVRSRGVARAPRLQPLPASAGSHTWEGTPEEQGERKKCTISKREFVTSLLKLLLKFCWQLFYMSDLVTKELYCLNRELQNFRRASPCLNAQHNEFVPTEHSPLTFQNLQHTKRETFVQISRILTAQVNRHCLLIFPLQ